MIITVEMLSDKFGNNKVKEAINFVDDIINNYTKPIKPILLPNASSSIVEKYLSELKDYELSNSKYEAFKNKNISILNEYLKINEKGIYYTDFVDEFNYYGVFYTGSNNLSKEGHCYLLDTKEACEEWCKENNNCLKEHGWLKI